VPLTSSRQSATDLTTCRRVVNVRLCVKFGLLFITAKLLLTAGSGNREKHREFVLASDHILMYSDHVSSAYHRLTLVSLPSTFCAISHNASCQVRCNDSGQSAINGTGTTTTQALSTVITARSELLKVLFWCCLWLFCLCMKYPGNHCTDLRQIHREDVFGPSLGRVWRSRSISAACVRLCMEKHLL